MGRRGVSPIPGASCVRGAAAGLSAGTHMFTHSSFRCLPPRSSPACRLHLPAPGDLGSKEHRVTLRPCLRLAWQHAQQLCCHQVQENPAQRRLCLENLRPTLYNSNSSNLSKLSTETQRKITCSSSSILYLCICHHGHQLPNINCYQTLGLATEMIRATTKSLIKNPQVCMLNKSLAAPKMASSLSSQLPGM